MRELHSHWRLLPQISPSEAQSDGIVNSYPRRSGGDTARKSPPIQLAEVASPAANSLHELAALFPRFRADSGRSVQQAAESAEVSPPPSGRPHPFLRVVCPTACRSKGIELKAVDVTAARKRTLPSRAGSGPHTSILTATHCFRRNALSLAHQKTPSAMSTPKTMTIVPVIW